MLLHCWIVLTQISGYVHRTLDESSIGWKIWRVAWLTLNCSLFSYFRTGWILTFVGGFTIGPCIERYLFTQIQSWRLPHDLPRIHATTPAVEKLEDRSVRGPLRSNFRLYQLKICPRFRLSNFVRLRWFRVWTEHLHPVGIIICPVCRVNIASMYIARLNHSN